MFDLRKNFQQNKIITMKHTKTTMENEKKKVNENPELNWPYYKDPLVRSEIDKLLEEMTSHESNMGRDSTPKEKEFYNNKKNTCLRKIWSLDIEFYNRLKPDNKKKQD